MTLRSGPALTRISPLLSAASMIAAARLPSVSFRPPAGYLDGAYALADADAVERMRERHAVDLGGEGPETELERIHARPGCEARRA